MQRAHPAEHDSLTRGRKDTRAIRAGVQEVVSSCILYVDLLIKKKQWYTQEM